MAGRSSAELGGQSNREERDETRGLCDALGANVRTADVADLAVLAGRLAYSQQVATLASCERVLRTQQKSRDEDVRVSCAKVLVALVPLSVPSIKGFFEKAGPDSCGEVQFSLLCFLDRLHDVSGAADFALELPSLLESFLMKVEDDPAQAGWMAADLLGDHWPLDSSLPALRRVALHAPHPTAREAGLHGLAHALENAEGAVRWSVMETVRQVVSRDTSAVVRARAQAILEGAIA